MGGVEFLRRFCMHIMPAGFVKVRYCGILGSRYKKDVQPLNPDSYRDACCLLRTKNGNEQTQNESKIAKLNEAELLFTALAELSTRQIAETIKADGIAQNAKAAKKGGKISREAREKLEFQTGKNVFTGDNFLQPNKQNSLPTIELNIE